VERAAVSYWRTATGEEVDLVVETGGRLLPIKVKATTTPRLADCAHLRSFR
jgi:predicted AAA+ superfamily ATPase